MQDASARPPDLSLQAVLGSPGLAPLLRVPPRLGRQSSWWGHVPFAAWLMAAARPGRLVELGTHWGVSYAAFCAAVRAEGLGTRCHAVDTWQGDAHAGGYDDAVWQDVSAYDAAHHAGLSTLHRSTFDAALADFADGSVDILHIDGLHTYAHVRHDFETWRPKLSDRAVVLFHDTAERGGDFGVWRFWEEVSAGRPAFAFPHCHGLGVLAFGPAVPAPVLELCALDGPEREAAMALFGTIGGRWEAEARALPKAEYDRLRSIEVSLAWRMARGARGLLRRVPGALPLLRRLG